MTNHRATFRRYMPEVRPRRTKMAMHGAYILWAIDRLDSLGAATDVAGERYDTTEIRSIAVIDQLVADGWRPNPKLVRRIAEKTNVVKSADFEDGVTALIEAIDMEDKA